MRRRTPAGEEGTPSEPSSPSESSDGGSAPSGDTPPASSSAAEDDPRRRSSSEARSRTPSPSASPSAASSERSEEFDPRVWVWGEPVAADIEAALVDILLYFVGQAPRDFIWKVGFTAWLMGTGRTDLRTRQQLRCLLLRRFIDGGLEECVALFDQMSRADSPEP